jgi:hypothetical protein
LPKARLPARAGRKVPNENEDRGEQDRQCNNHDINQKGDASPGENAVEQLGIRQRIIGVRLHLDGKSDPSRSCVGHAENPDLSR